jgi:lipoprotein-anchoring transpeptidase ErfK/SrfK
MQEDDKINSGPESGAEQNPDMPHMTSSENVPVSSESFFQKARENEKFIKSIRISIGSIVSVIIILFIAIFILYLVPGLQEITSGQKTEFKDNPELKKDKNYLKQTVLLTKDIQRLSKKYSSYTSGQSYIVINTTDNRFFLYKNKKLIREGYCSSGSYTMLKTESEKKWIFKTPKGKYWIHGKITSPVWRRPDWSFVEEGLPIPSENDPSRWEYGVLGDYAMSIGDGYLIHGTLYKRFLGMPVTHGCVRLNDEDLEAIYNTLSIGSKVYIF